MAAIPKLAAQTGPAALVASGGKPVLDFKTKARAAATEFEAVFLNSMFNQMFTGVGGPPPLRSRSAACCEPSTEATGPTAAPAVW